MKNILQFVIVIAVSILIVYSVSLAITAESVIRPDTEDLPDDEKVIILTEPIEKEFEVSNIKMEYDEAYLEITDNISRINAFADKWNAIFISEGIDYTFSQYELQIIK